MRARGAALRAARATTITSVAERQLSLVSVVAPMLNEEETARIFCDRVRDAMDGLRGS